MKKFFKAVVVGLALVSVMPLTACSSEADTVSNNLSVQAEKFEINRRVVFINGITDTYLLTIEGLCSVESSGARVAPGPSRSPARPVTTPTSRTAWCCPTT